MTTIFLVDDNKTQRKLIASSLKNLTDVSITQFDSSVDLLKFAKSNVPDVVITDFVLPDMTGLELITKLKKIHPSCKFLILTSGFDQGLVPDGHDHSSIEITFGCPILYKPFNPTNLNDIVLELIKNKVNDKTFMRIKYLPGNSDLFDQFNYNKGENVLINGKDEKGLCLVAKIDLDGYGSWIEEENLES